MTAEVQGTCDDRFSVVRDILAANLDQGEDVGASVAMTVEGELVVDIWGGWSDEAKTSEWERDTITNVWSTTKTMTAPVSRYWPEFAAGGKGDRVLVRHLLGHTAGLAGWSEPLAFTDLYDWEKCASMLAAQEPWWEPGTASGYHALTQGYLVGEVIRRVTGQTVGTFFRKEVAEPLGADFHIGLDPADFSRVANVIPPPPVKLPEDAAAPPMALRSLTNPPLDVPQVWTEGWRRAEIPAANGHGNARSVATVQAIMANGGVVGGHRFLSESGVERVLEEQSNGTDLVLGVPIRFGMGYGLPSDLMPMNESGRACFWGGYGGSIIVVDMEHRATFAYMMNRMKEGLVGDERGLSLVAAAAAALAA